VARTPAPAAAPPNRGTPDVHEQLHDVLDGLRQAKAPRDPQKVWNDAFNKNLFRPQQVMAVANALAVGDKFDEVAVLLQADLRKGLLAEPAVFDALAIALKASGGTPQEQERVRLSVIDLAPKNPQSYLRAADAMQELGKPDKALAFCKQAAALEPNAADPYAKGLVCLAKASGKDVDTDAVQWAAGNLIRRDWAADQDLHRAQAKQALADAAARLRAAGRAADADKVQADLDREQVRDLVVEAVWSDQADLDLEVTEPTGAVCGPRQPQSTGGGLWRGDRLFEADRSEKFKEAYTAAEAFSGSYEVRVKKAWGRPLGDKVTVKVTRHQGAANQAQELYRLTLGSDGMAYLKVHLEDGRRTQLTTVPPPAPRKAPPAAAAGPDRVYNLLRAMAQPGYAGQARSGMTGGAAAAGQMFDTPPEATGEEVVHQNKLNTADTLRTGAEIMGETVVAADRSKVTVRMAPVFRTATDRPEVKLSAIPGGQ
jgi:tetratricopeptide (TPR) repeat protein